MKVRSLLVLLLSFLLLTGSFGQGRIADFGLSKGDLIENILFNYYDDYGFNGSVLVVEKGSVIYENTFGFADFTTKDPLDAHSPFYIASLSKQFTAAMIVKLAEEGKLSLADPMTKYLPMLPAFYDEVKIHHLLTHSGGIADYFAMGLARDGLTNQDVYRAVRNQQSLEFKPGYKFKYSNSGYVLLAMIGEIAAGMQYEDYLQQTFFDKVGMNDTFVFTAKTYNKNKVKGYTSKLKPDDYALLTKGDGGIYSTARDLYKWEEALNNGKIVSEDLLEVMYTPLVLKNGRTRKYGYGWEIGSNTGGKLVYHTGGLAGFRTYLERQLTSHNVVIILTNNSFSQVEELRNLLVKVLDGRVDALPETK